MQLYTDLSPVLSSHGQEIGTPSAYHLAVRFGPSNSDYENQDLIYCQLSKFRIYLDGILNSQTDSLLSAYTNTGSIAQSILAGPIS